ncbi:nucleotidyltransferase domain-containing protein [Marinobacter salexigens]|uniref:Nucleotidyltransferase domain-containing protein n=1 Tax=Marinobacter salexigens TaxID=1925763 RepID=A0ABS6ACX9_9GAMM|nr:nucleotidyltransferase domain-containing protein [Marinobacter salexigens]MBU2875047.1 nucleotidyltransferase domain-containing protein [Marinobacter salexigens]
MEFPLKVQAVIDQLKAESCSKSVWFIGSRANGKFRPDSDWDFICFRNSAVEEREARSRLVDIVQVGIDGQYLLEGQHYNLTGQFEHWQWHEIDSQRAEYKSRVTPKIEAGAAFDLSDAKIVTNNAYKVWDRDA